MNYFAYLRSRRGKLFSNSWLLKNSKPIRKKATKFKVTGLPNSQVGSAGVGDASFHSLENGDDSSNSSNQFDRQIEQIDQIEPELDTTVEDVEVDDVTFYSLDSTQDAVPQVKVIDIDEKHSKLILLDPETSAHYVILKETCIRLTLVHGSVLIDGYRVKVDQTVSCIATSPYYFTLVEPQACDSSKEQLFSQLSKYVVDGEKRMQLIEELNKSKGKCQMMTVLMADKHADTSTVSRVFHQIRCSKFCYTEDERLFSIFIKPSDQRDDFDQIKAWDEALDEQLKITPSTVLMALGPANSGKSMLIKRMINRILSRDRTISSSVDSSAQDVSSIIYVDLDPGQSEFSPPGVLSVTKLSMESSRPLFPVPFANSLFDSPIFTVSVASINPQSDPDAYVRAILSISQFIRENFRNKYPIFINTIGWVTGLGRCLLVDAIKSINPSDVIEIVDLSQRGKSNRPPSGHQIDGSNRPCNLFSFSSVTTPGLGWTVESQIPVHRSLLTPYNYIQLNSNRMTERMAVIGQWNRSSQVLTNFLRNEFFHFQGLSFSKKQTLDLTKVAVYSAYSRQQIPPNILLELLDLAWVQLIVCEGHQLQPTTFDSCCNIKIATTLSNNQVIGYGITFIQTRATSAKENSCPNLLDQSLQNDSLEDTSSTYFAENTCVNIFTPLSQDELAKVNLLIIPQGVTIPGYILRQVALI